MSFKLASNGQQACLKAIFLKERLVETAGVLCPENKDKL